MGLLYSHRPECPDALRDLLQRCWADEPGQRPSFEACVAELAKASIMLCTNSRFLAAELGSPAHKPLGPWQQVAAPAGLLDAVAGIPVTGPHAVKQLHEYATQALRTARLKQSSRVTNPHDLSVDEIGAIVVYTKEWARAHGTSLCASPRLLTGHHFPRTANTRVFLL